MTKLSLTRVAVAIGGLTLSLTARAAVASAGPDLGPAINTTCTYDQAHGGNERARPDNCCGCRLLAGDSVRFASVPRRIAQSTEANGPNNN